MDFGDILTLLIYIAIPVFISGKRKAKKAQEEARRKRPPMQQPMQSPAQRQPMKRRPVQGSTGDGGIFGRLESMLKELERAAQSGKPAGGSKPSGGPAKPGETVDAYTDAEGTTASAQAPGGYHQGQQASGIPVWRVANEIVGKETPAKPGVQEKPVSKRVSVAAEQGGYALFGKDDLVKGIILSEILQPPVALRQKNKRRPF
ncbi:MAG: hypothetical protein ACOX42_10705 [Clostridia bacterium]|jgi:hypothetical protein|nr:hypothetical protein [Clostridiales bacterium]